MLILAQPRLRKFTHFSDLVAENQWGWVSGTMHWINKTLHIIVSAGFMSTKECLAFTKNLPSHLYLEPRPFEASSNLQFFLIRAAHNSKVQLALWPLESLLRQSRRSSPAAKQLPWVFFFFPLTARATGKSQSLREIAIEKKMQAVQSKEPQLATQVMKFFDTRSAISLKVSTSKRWVSTQSSRQCILVL